MSLRPTRRNILLDEELDDLVANNFADISDTSSFRDLFFLLLIGLLARRMAPESWNLACSVTHGRMTSASSSTLLSPTGGWHWHVKNLHGGGTVLKGQTRRSDPTIIRCDEKLLETFEKAKDLFSNYVLLHYPRINSISYVTANVSNLAVGAVLEQDGDNGTRKPLRFFSRKLD